MAEKKYYWIKLKQSLMTSDKVDYLMSQKDGANYVVLYQCLCLLCVNTNGVLGKEIGEVLIPFDVNKIQRDTKWFSTDTIVVALELYKRLGLIYQLDNGLYQIKDFTELVGGETASAKRVRKLRAKQNEMKALQCNTDVTQEIDIDNREKNIDKNILDKNKIKKLFDKKNIKIDYIEISNFIKENELNLNAFDEWKKINLEEITNWKEYLTQRNLKEMWK